MYLFQHSHVRKEEVYVEKKNTHLSIDQPTDRSTSQRGNPSYVHWKKKKKKKKK
jgi:hypothetical protein